MVSTKNVEEVVLVQIVFYSKEIFKDLKMVGFWSTNSYFAKTNILDKVD